MTTARPLGSVISLWRYPVKSVMGEELNTSEVTTGGLLGDRGFALVDASNGKVVSAKNPRKWTKLFEMRATFVESPRIGAKLPAVRIMLPDGTLVSSEQANVNQILSQGIGREVVLQSVAPQAPTLEEYWPDIQELDRRDVVTDEAMPSKTFFDCSSVHVLTTATIDQLRKAYAQGRFEVRRFRPNIVVAPASGESGFVENAWVGHTVAIGEQVRLRVTGPCPRCVMTTLPQGDLPQDAGILRTAAQQNQAHVGVYASVIQAGTIQRGDSVLFAD